MVVYEVTGASDRDYYDSHIQFRNTTNDKTIVVKKGSKALANIAERRLKTGQATDIVKTVEEFISSHPNLKSYEVNMLRHNAFLDKTDYVAFLMKQFSK